MLPQFGQWKAKLTIMGKEVLGREIVLPMPPSENTRLEPNWQAMKAVAFGSFYANAKKGKTRKGALRNSTQYNRWINAAQSMLRKGHLPKLQGEIACFVTVVFPDHHTRDGHNRHKALLDSFTKSECVYDDDVQVTLLTIDTKIIKDSEFVVCFVVERSKLEKLGFEISAEYLLEKVKQVNEQEQNLS